MPDEMIALLRERRKQHEKKLGELRREEFAHQVSIAEINYLLKQLEEENDHAENSSERAEDA